MNSAARCLPGIALGLVAAIALPAAATAQQLWNIEEVTAQPVPPILMDGVAVSAAAAGAPTAEAATVQVAFDYLRLGMGYLELPVPGGAVIETENAVFEDRGDGDLMWTGEVPGAGYESVVLTVQDGHLVGWFGEPGGPKYVVYAGPDGRGSLAEEVGPTGDWCGVANGEQAIHPSAVARPARDRSESFVRDSTTNRLDILALYTSGTEHYWRVIGGPAVGVQQLEDYLNMVFRNGAIPATANLIPVLWDPMLFNHPRHAGFHFPNNLGQWQSEFATSPEVWRLAKRYRADLVHFLPEIADSGAGGRAQPRQDFDPKVLVAYSRAFPPYIFAHEIGHNLGGEHEPAAYGDYFLEQQSQWALRPYAFGHTDMTSCSKREGYGNSLICPITIMSYGQDANRDNDPRTFASREPFYSSVRHKPNGWTIGVAGTSEVERVFQETVPVAVRSGEESTDWYEQRPRRITARWTGRDSVRVTWKEEDEFAIHVALVTVGGANDAYQLQSTGGRPGDPFVLDEAWSSDNLTPVLDESGAFLKGVEMEGLRPGGEYRLAARGSGRCDFNDGCIWASASDVLELVPPRAAAGGPAAPELLATQVTAKDSVRLTWQSGSPGAAGGYEVWYRKWSDEEPDEVWRRYGGPLPASTRHLEVNGLAAEEEIRVVERYWDPNNRVWVRSATAKRGRYSFVVVAYNDQGFNASETYDLEFLPEPYPEPTASGETTDCAVWSRPTGIDLDGYQVHACLETPDGARRRAWDYRLEADQSALLYFFNRDNAEILVKVLDGCAINGHRWVYLAPVTTLAFRLLIRELGPNLANRRQVWYYDSERRPQDRINAYPLYGKVGNPKDRTARTVSDTTAFPCTVAEIADARAESSGSGDDAGLLARAANPLPHVSAASATPLAAGALTDCEPGGPTLTLRGGYTVSMCYETYKGEIGDAKDWGLDSTQSGLLYFFQRNNAEVLIKVLDGCGVNGYRWVFVAPVTDLAFNLRVESPDGSKVWNRTNRLGQTADAWSDVSAFPCTA